MSHSIEKIFGGFTWGNRFPKTFMGHFISKVSRGFTWGFVKLIFADKTYFWGFTWGFAWVDCLWDTFPLFNKKKIKKMCIHIY